MADKQKGTKGYIDKKYLRLLIRRTLIKDPNISSRELAKILDCNHKTAWKLMKTVKEENIIRMEKEIENMRTITVEQELAKIEKENAEVVRELWNVISASKVSYKEKVNALRAIVMARKEIFNLKFDAGLFIKSLGKLDVNVAELVKKLKEAEDDTGGDNSESSL